MTTCPDCHSEFEDRAELEEHKRDYITFACLTCAKEFKYALSLKMHCEDTMHRDAPLGPRKKKQRLQMYLQDAFYLNQVFVERSDRLASRKVVQKHLRQIMHNVIGQRDGELYSKKLRPAGSTATQTKIGKADEYDYNVVLQESCIGELTARYPDNNGRKRFQLQVSNAFTFCS